MNSRKRPFWPSLCRVPANRLLGFAVMGGVFGEGVDLTGDRLIGVGIVGPRGRRLDPGRSSCGTILSRHAVPALTTPTVTPA